MKQLNKQEKKQLVVYDTRKEQPNIWNLQAFVIVFLFIMLATTINVYSVNNDNLTWVDSNGDFKLDSYDHSMINLDTDLIELNNQSLNDIFLDGNLIPNHDFSDSSISFYTNYNGSIYNHDTGVLIGTGNNSSTRAFVFIDNMVNITDTYYLSAEHKTEISNNASNRTYSGSLSTSVLTGNNDWQRYREKDVAGNIRFFLSDWRSDTLLSSDKVYIDNIFVINMSDLGIDNLTQAQMDLYYDLYVSLQENRIEAYKDLGNEPISQWQNLTQTVSSLIDDILQPVNDVNDWINKFMQGLFS